MTKKVTIARHESYKASKAHEEELFVSNELAMLQVGSTLQLNQTAVDSYTKWRLLGRLDNRLLCKRTEPHQTVPRAATVQQCLMPQPMPMRYAL